MPSDSEETPSQKHGLFPETDWSLVMRATGRRENTDDHTALSDLCQRYWKPLYTYVRSLGKSREEAEDLVQSFFAKLLRNQNLASTDEAKGRLRSFLLVAMRRFVQSDWRKQLTQRRGEGQRVLTLDADEGENLMEKIAGNSPDPAQAYTKAWALTLLSEARHRLRQDYLVKGETQAFDLLQSQLGDPTATEFNSAEIAKQLGITENTVRVRLFRLRKQFLECLREEVALGLETHADVDEELAALRDALRNNFS